MRNVKLLFVCSRNKWRSLTAEKIFSRLQGYEVRSAGTSNNARIKVNAAHIGWADIIFVMEKRHKTILKQKFRAELGSKQLITLDIPDEYQFMDEALIELLQSRVAEHIALENNPYLTYSFTAQEVESVVKAFGQSFYDKVLSYIAQYSAQWSLTNFQLVPSYSANLVFLCRSAQYGPAVLKIARSTGHGFLTELQALQHYHGKGVCRLLQFDAEHGILLLEQVQPGNTLRELASLEQRLSVFCSIYKKLHVAPLAEARFPTYQDWVNAITDFMSGEQHYEKLYQHMKQAQTYCQEVSKIYSQSLLLHGDLHHDNILLGSDGQYVVIDPKGVVGDAVFDIPRFILNEFEDALTEKLAQKMCDIFAYFERELAVPQHILRKLLYIETSMGACWYVEDGITAEEYEHQLARVEFAESLLT